MPSLAVIVGESRPHRPILQKLFVLPPPGPSSEAPPPREVPVSASSRSRPIIAVWLDAERVVIVTQLQDAQGDNPEILAYDFKKKRWFDVAYVSCPKVLSLRVSRDAFEFECTPFQGAKADPGGRATRKVKHGLALEVPEGTSVDLGMFRVRHESGGNEARVEGSTLVMKTASGMESRFEAARLWEGPPK